MKLRPSCSQHLKPWLRPRPVVAAMVLAGLAPTPWWGLAEVQAQVIGPAGLQGPPPLSPVAPNTTSADAPVNAGVFETDGQPGIGPRPFTSFVQRIASPVDRIEIEGARDNQPADGLSAQTVRVRLLDGNRMPLSGRREVTLEVDGGARIQLPGRRTDETGPGRGDADRLSPGVQVETTNGVVEFRLVAPSRPDTVTLKVTVDGRVQRLQLRYQPELREMIAVGLLEGQVRSDKFDPRQIVPVRENDAFDTELRQFSREFNGGATRVGARAAMYLKGKVSGAYLLTLAYDSEKDTRNTLFKDIDPNAFYPVYGDSSIRGVDAQSSGKLYVRLDRGRSFVMWGDYETSDPNPARRLSQYSRTLPGLRARYEEGNVTANTFYARQAMRQVVDEFPGRGVSGPYSVSNPNGVQGSEKIEILVRSRTQSSVILKATPLTRSADYEFEPFDGRIVFRAPVPSFDDQLNPVSIRVTYEVDQGGQKFDVYGADVVLKVSPSLSVGVAHARDENPAAPQQVSGLNVHLKLSKSTELIAEVAQSTSTVNTGASGFNTSTSANFAGRVGEFTGNAARVELRHSDETLRARISAARSDDEFNNSSAGMTRGRTDLGAQASYRVNRDLTITTEAQSARDRIAGSQNDSASVAADLKLSDRLTVGGGVRRAVQNSVSVSQQTDVRCVSGALVSYSGNVAGYNTGYGISQSGNQLIDPATGLPVVCNSAVNPSPTVAPGVDATAVFARAAWRATDRLTLDSEVQHAEGTNPSDSVSVGARYAVTSRLGLTASMRQEFAGSDASQYSLGADWRVADKTRLYSRYEYAHQYGGAYGLGGGPMSRSFAVGVDTQYMDEGSLFSEYRLTDSSSGRAVQNAVGLRNGWRVAPGVRLLTNVERVVATSGDATAIGVGVEYTASELWKGSARVEWRQDNSNTNTLITLGATRKLDRNWTLVAREYYTRTEPRVAAATDTWQNRLQLGFAYRPVDNNRFDALGLYERKDQRDMGAGLDSGTDIISVRANYHPSRPWWYSGRVAYKRVSELLLGTVSDNYHATLVGARVTYDITNRWTIGALTTVMVGKGGGRQYAYGLEAGYIVVDNLWVTLGYNWRGFSDDDLAGSNYTNRGWVLGVRYKFDEDLLRGDNPSTNKTLAPAAGKKDERP